MSVKSYLPYRYKTDYSQLPFFVENVSNSDATLYVRKNGDPAPSITVEYSTDNTTWATLGTTTTSGIAYNLPARKRVYLRCTASAWSNTGGVSNIININQSSIVGGNTMSLLYGSDFQNKTFFPSGSDCNFWGLFSSSKIADASNLILPATTLTSDCYRSMFNGCTTLATPPKLPATTLASYCYQQMFEGCSSLSVAPELPATTLAYGCYTYMFYNCSALTAAPALPATTLANDCYQNMFGECRSLSIAPELPATTLAYGCYVGMFKKCIALTAAPALPATTLANSCYMSMFRECVSLTSTPTLPATTLTSSCYYAMFYGCTSLTSTTTLPATTLANNCYGGMFQGCTSLTTPPALPATTLANNCYAAMFCYCSSITTSPELPATTLNNYCYSEMFAECTLLNDVTICADDISATSCLNNWLNNVASTGTLHNNGNATYPTNSVSGIPSGWTEVRPSRGTGWTPDDPLDVTGDELEGMLGGGAKAGDKPEANIGYFYNVTKESKVFKIGEYVVTDPSTAVLYNKKNSMSFKDFKEMAEKGNLSKGDIYYTTDEEKVYAAVSASDYQEIERKSPTPKNTGWTPDDPLDVTGDELEEMLGGGAKEGDKPEANIGYFYNVTEKGKTYDIGLYVVTDPSTAVLYNKKNSMTFKDFNEMAEKGSLVKGAIYYTTDEEKVYAAQDNSNYTEIERKSPTPKNTGWTPDDPIEMGDEDFDEMIKMKNALQGYFYYTPKRDLQVAVNPGYSVQFDKKRVMSEKTFYEIAGKDGLEENAVYYTDDSQKVFIATDKSKYEEITRTAPKSTEPIAEK